MKKIICLFLAIIISVSVAYISTHDELPEPVQKIVDIVDSKFGKSDDEKINDTIDAMIDGYNTGDMKAVMATMEPRRKNAASGAVNIGGSILSKIAGFGINLESLYSLGVASCDLSIDITDRKIKYTSSAEAKVSANYIDRDGYQHIQSTTKVNVVMVKIKNKWYIKGIETTGEEPKIEILK